MESKLISEPTFKINNFRDESSKALSPDKIYLLEMKPKEEPQFKSINNNSKELFISSKKKDMSLNKIKPKLLKGTLPQVFNIIEKRHSSYDKKDKDYSEKKFNNSNININKERKDESPIMNLKDYTSKTEQKGFKNYNPKINNYFRAKALSPVKQLNPVKEKNSENIIISEVNLNENGDEIDFKNKTNFSDFETTKTLIRNKTIATNFSSIGFDIMNDNRSNYNDYKFNVRNNNINIINNKNQIANKYQNQFFPFGNETKNNNNKKYDNIYIENNTINNRQNNNQLINQINIDIRERSLVKRSPSETHEKNNYTIENMKDKILNYNFNRNKRINTHQNEKIDKSDNKYYSHDNKKLRKYIDNKNNIQINLNEGITYQILNGYKYNFNLSNVEIYILKEIHNTFVIKLKDQIKLWKKKYNNESIYMKIFDIKINIPEGHSTIIMEHPIGGENLTHFVNSIGFNDENILLKIISKLYNYILFLQNEKYFSNIPFCLCDIFFDVYDQVKIIPPLIRKISYLYYNNNNVENDNINEKCICKYYFNKIKNIFEINNNYISNFCLGFTIIQLLTQNLIFKIKSFDILINNKNNKDLKKCCLIHTLLTIEILFCDKKEDLLLSNFLELYPKIFIQFLHECTDFNGKNINQTFERLCKLKDNKDNNEKNLKIQIKELLKIVELPTNNYCRFDKFLQNFEILYKNFNINPDIFNHSLKKKKIISSLSRVFHIQKKELVKYFLQIIKNTDEKYY